MNTAAEIIRIYHELVKEARDSCVAVEYVQNELINFAIFATKDKWTVYFELNGRKVQFNLTDRDFVQFRQPSKQLFEYLSKCIANELLKNVERL